MPSTENNNVEHDDLYRRLFLSQIPMIDLRAPVEFDKGAFPASYNYPLMTNDERAQVGTCYKEHGSEAAVELGYQLVDHDLDNRINQWAQFKSKHPTAWLYCFRGGMRSHLTAQMLKEHGVEIDIVPGGYKALRHFLLDVIEQTSRLPITLVSGNTGCGKTLLINNQPNGLDLEGRANHRGSSFGQQPEGQPTQSSYENELAIDMLNITQGWRSLVIEDESRLVGSRDVPLPLFTMMKQSPMVVIDDPFETRLQRLLKEYCGDMLVKYRSLLGDEAGWQAYCDYLHHGLYGIRKRLGSEKYIELNRLLEQALKGQQSHAGLDEHLNWLVPVLKDYYDPMYQYQINNAASRIQFMGSYDEVQEWLVTHQAPFKL